MESNQVQAFDIDLSSYDYDLPESRIAKFPISPRDHARLLVYQSGNICHQRFYELAEHLPEDSLMVFNNTRVIPARLFFQRKTGALIEIFLMQSHRPHIVSEAMSKTGNSEWRCLVGNKKRWKAGEILSQTIPSPEGDIHLEAELVDREQQIVALRWQGAKDYRFVDLLKLVGEMPLPPYLKRRVAKSDQETYQTVYSEKEGAVAAPTAGLHFTEKVLQSLKNKGIRQNFLTLHVGGGTFQPIKSGSVVEHPMHSEQLIFNRENIRELQTNIGKTIAVGTTSMRAMESLYWFGVMLWERQSLERIPFQIPKLYPYNFEDKTLPTLAQSLENIEHYMAENALEELIGETEIFIFPGYRFRVCRGLITNYHMPQTTLVLLIAAFVGSDWRKIYDAALSNDYRFLSYGDSSLLYPDLEIL